MCRVMCIVFFTFLATTLWSLRFHHKIFKLSLSRPWNSNLNCVSVVNFLREHLPPRLSYVMGPRSHLKSRHSNEKMRKKKAANIWVMPWLWNQFFVVVLFFFAKTARDVFFCVSWSLIFSPYQSACVCDSPLRIDFYQFSHQSTDIGWLTSQVLVSITQTAIEFVTILSCMLKQWPSWSEAGKRLETTWNDCCTFLPFGDSTSLLLQRNLFARCPTHIMSVGQEFLSTLHLRLMITIKQHLHLCLCWFDMLAVLLGCSSNHLQSMLVSVLRCVWQLVQV